MIPKYVTLQYYFRDYRHIAISGICRQGYLWAFSLNADKLAVITEHHAVSCYEKLHSYNNLSYNPKISIRNVGKRQKLLQMAGILVDGTMLCPFSCIQKSANLFIV